MRLERLERVIRRWMVGLTIRLSARKKRPVMMSLNDCWEHVSQCIVCWPENKIDVISTDYIYMRLREKFPLAAISTVVRPGCDAFPPDIGVDIIQIRHDDFNIFGFPNHRLKAKLKKLKADIAIDLSPEYNPLSAYCCVISGARIIIGFAMGKSESVFNYQVAPRQGRTGAERYRILADYIG